MESAIAGLGTHCFKSGTVFTGWPALQAMLVLITGESTARGDSCLIFLKHAFENSTLRYALQFWE